MVKNIPTGVSRLIKILSNEDAEVDQIIELLRHFPVICIRLIKVSNSAWVAPKTEITDVKRACLQLGLKMVKSISIALLVSQQFNTKTCKGFNERRFWLSSLVMADLMYFLVKQDQNGDKENDAATAHLIGLIHNLGLLAIAEIAPEKVSQAILVAENSTSSFSEALEKIVGISFLQASELILHHWEIPLCISYAYDQASNKSTYTGVFQQAVRHKKQLDLIAMPFQRLDDTEEYKVNDSVVEKSADYEELCTLYCR